MKVGYKKLIEEAEKNIETVSVDQVAGLFDDETVTIVDIRDIRELQREGKLPGAVHAPRGMLEFWIDPESPYHKPIFQQNKKFIFYCASGWRSALATSVAVRMGLKPVANLDGGFSAWKDAGGSIEHLK